ncbi:BEL1-like homeodomain protein 8 [Aristolochia californica]|uniref:BEL1-like homeodomain protein 8 n=1 Tax=Aristolochia californica TaxID=171875 RepID=UPI0035E0FC00
MLGMSSFGAESHVAQQSRRDKLRVQQNSNQTNNIQELPGHLLHQSRESLLSPDVVQVRNSRNCDLLHDPIAMLSSDVLDFASSAHLLLPHKEVVSHQDRSVRPEAAPFGSPSELHSSKAGEAQGSNYWSTNYSSGSASNVCNQSPLVVGSIVPGNIKENSIFAAASCLKPGQSGYQDVQDSLNNPPSELSNQEHKQLGEICFSSPSFYQNALQEVVTSTSVGSQGFEMPALLHPNARECGHGSWNGAGNELVLLPSYGTAHPTSSRLSNAGQWKNRNMDNSYSGGGGFLANRSDASFGTMGSTDNSAQGLSLSLSSHQPSELNATQLEGRFGSASEASSSRGGIFHSFQDSKSIHDVGSYGLYSKNVVGGRKFFGNSIQSVVTPSMDVRRAAGPLGPFTGYATILKSSKFLKPARQLLDELSCISGSKLVKATETSERGSGEASTSSDVFNVDNEVGGLSGSSGGSGSTPFYSSTETCTDVGGSNAVYQGFRPEFQRKKAKLKSMQEEVGRRYKQYHQQMQMVISSFDSVAGLSAATPYISFALKSVSKHFRTLKHAISEQIRNVSKALGEEVISVALNNDDIAMQKLRFFEHSFRKHKVSDNLAFMEHQQPVWRPQRGLPERAVAVLRAWLFEHFLHPYPTDTDKHTLAAQTGLSRNQVSNWFINARVRVWKPMVEEIHMLETKGSAEMELNSVKTDGKAAAKKAGGPSMNQPNAPVGAAIAQKQSLDISQNKSNLNQWHPEKRSKMEECQISASVDSGRMGFMPYPSGMEIIGPGAVSLTLGLRHSAETMQLQQQQEQQLRQLEGHHLVHDFTG